MTNPPPPFQVPDGNEPDDNGQQQGQYGPPQGDPQAYTPPYGMPAPHNPQPPRPPQQQAWSPPPAPDQQWQPPQQDQQWQPAPPDPQQWQPPQGQQGQQWQPPQQDQQWAPPPPAPQQFGAPAGPQGGQQPPFVPPQSSAPQPSPAPQQFFGDAQPQPQWSSGGGFAAPAAAAGAGAGAAAFPAAGPTGFDSGPGGGMPPAASPLGHGSRPGSGPGGFPPQGPPPTPYAPPARPQDRHLGPPRAHRPPRHRRSVLLPVALGALLVAGVAIPAAAKQADKEVGGSSAGEPLAKADVIWSIREGRDGPATPVTKMGEEKLNRTGVWYTDSTVVVAEAKRLAAYNLDTGALAWEYASSDGEFVCNVDIQSDAKQAIVAFGGEDDCSSLEGIDVVAGKKIWSTPIQKEESDSDYPGLGDFSKYNLSRPIVVSGGVAVFNDVAYRTSDGRKLWSTESALGEDCSADLSGGYAGGAKLVVMASCGGGLNSSATVTELDPMTGQAKWTFDAPAGSYSDTVSVVSTDPVMIMKAPLLSMGDASPEITVLDDQGREAFKITEGYPVVSPRGSDAGTDTVPVLATDTTIYVPGSDRSGSFGGIMDGANLITAYDRATGQKLWTQNMAVGSKIFKLKSAGSIFPIRVEESGDLLVLVQDGGTTALRPMSLIRVSAKDGSMTNLKELPKRVTVAKLALIRGMLVHEQNGRVYLTGFPSNDPSLEDAPIKNALGQSVHYDMSVYRVIAMQ